MDSELTLIEQIKSGKLWSFPGGVHPPERKALSNTGEIGIYRAQKIYLPIKQHIGQAGDLLVQKGEQVLKGQALTRPAAGLSLPVHAPCSGKIIEIREHVAAHPSGALTPTLVIEPDGQDLSVEAKPLENWRETDKARVIQHLQDLGVAGLGGAAFPTYVKTSVTQHIELLIINAVECEPYITSDDMLMRTHSDEIINGCEILRHLVNAPHCIIAIEDNKPQAIAEMRLACEHISEIDVQVVPTKYPSGGEKQLIQLVTGRQVPSGGIPADIGLVMQNVGTSYAIKRAVIDGDPLIDRIVTVTGESISRPQNLWVPFGTPISELLDEAGFEPQKNQRLIMGGPMMGFNIIDTQMPVVKSTNCILAPGEYQLPAPGVEQACIRCGMCADVCPAELLPQQLQWFAKAKDHDKLKDYNLFDCIECGACAYVCPSQIPLVQYYRSGKAEIREAEAEKAKAEKAKLRFEQRQARLEREKEERLKRHQDAADKRRQAMAKDDSAKDKIAAALARAKAKKAGQGETEEAPKGNTESSIAPTPQDKVAAAIARAKAKKSANTASGTAKAEVDAPKDKVAAAIARAKARKAEQSSEPPSSSAEPASVCTEAETPKDKVATAIARAKAKKAAKQAEQNTLNKDGDTSVDSAQSAPPETQLSPEEEKKAKVAAAIRKAKLKKQSAALDSKEGETKEPALSPKGSPEDERKAKIAAAIAKAKAKKLAAQDNKNEVGNE